MDEMDVTDELAKLMNENDLQMYVDMGLSYGEIGWMVLKEKGVLYGSR